jgi:hypothetical protein
MPSILVVVYWPGVKSAGALAQKVFRSSHPPVSLVLTFEETMGCRKELLQLWGEHSSSRDCPIVSRCFLVGVMFVTKYVCIVLDRREGVDMFYVCWTSTFS